MSNLIAVTDWEDANTRLFIGITVSGAVQSFDQNGIGTVLSSIESVNDVNHLAYMQSVRAIIMKMYTHTQMRHCKNNMASLRSENKIILLRIPE